MTKTVSDKADLRTALKDLVARLPAGRDGRRNRRALARWGAIVALAAIAAMAMPTACSKAPPKVQVKDATITLFMDLESGEHVPDSKLATVLHVTDPNRLEALLAFFPEMDRGKESWRAGGWEAGVKIAFAKRDGKTIRVSVSSNDDLTVWSEGHGDWPVNGDLKAFLLALQKAQAATQSAAQMVLHIVSAAEWQRARQAGSYEPTSLGSGGFVHCSTPEQIIRVANANFRGKSGLVLLCINPKRLKAPVRYENLEGGTSLFPHIYGPVNLEAVVEVLDFAPQQDGTFLLPAKLVPVPSASSGPAPEGARRPAAPRPATQPAEGPVQTDWSAPREGVQMRLRAARKTWRADEIPALRWDVRNVGTRKFLEVGDGQRQAQLEVDGLWYQWPPGMRWARLADLGAGAWLEDQLVTASPIWSQAKPEDLEWRMDGGGGIVLKREKPPLSLHLKAGSHTIRLAVVIQPSRVDTGDGFRVVSEPMDITIEALPAGQTASWPPGTKLAQAVKEALHVTVFPLQDSPRPFQPKMKDWIARALAAARLAASQADRTLLHASASRLAEALAKLQQAVDKDPAGAANEFSAAWTAYAGLVDVLAGVIQPTTQPVATQPVAKLAPEQERQRDKLLTEAGQKLKQGLIELRKTFPQLAVANNKSLDDAVKGRSGPGRLGLVLGRGNKPSKTPWEPEAIADTETWSLLAVVHPTGGRTTTAMAMFDLYPCLGLEGQCHAMAGDPKLDAALKKLMNESLAPMKAFDVQVSKSQPAVGEPATQPAPSASSGQATAPALAGATTQPAAMVITPGVGVGPVTLGMSREEVIKHLGKPVRIEGEGGYGLNYISSLGLSVLVSRSKGVVSISCWTSRVMYWLYALGMKDFRGVTDKGIKMGAGRDEIVRAYGRADSESGGAPLYMDYRSEGIKFILCSGKLAQIEVVEPDVFALIPAAAFSQPAAMTQPATQPATQPGG